MIPGIVAQAFAAAALAAGETIGTASGIGAAAGTGAVVAAGSAAGTAAGTGAAAGVGAKVGVAVGTATGTGAATATGAATYPLATLDGTPTDTTMSNGNLTATHANTNDNAGVRSASTKTSIKAYYEITIGQSTGAGDCVGCLGVDALSSYPPGFGAGAVVFRSNGKIFSNFSDTGIAFGAISAGSVISIATDIQVGTAGAARTWIRVNGGNWNNNASYDPAAGTGYFAMGGGALTYSPGVIFAGTGRAAGDNFTLNCGQNTYAYTPPSGFGNWTL